MQIRGGIIPAQCGSWCEWKARALACDGRRLAAHTRLCACLASSRVTLRASFTHRHPASGYVQGINDLVTPFLAVFLGEHFPRDAAMATWDLTTLSEEAMLEVCHLHCWLIRVWRGVREGHAQRQRLLHVRVRPPLHKAVSDLFGRPPDDR